MPLILGGVSDMEEGDWKTYYGEEVCSRVTLEVLAGRAVFVPGRNKCG
jgi:hypothetical protein